MNKDIVIRRFTISDVGNVLSLLERAFKQRYSDEWWNWKYRLNPAGFRGEDGDIWVAEMNGKIVSYFAVIPVRMKLGSETVTAALSVDVATDPDFRGLGLFTTLARKVNSDCEKTYDFLYAYPSRMSFKGFLKLGWRCHGVEDYARVLNYNAPLGSYVTKDMLLLPAKALLKATSMTNRLTSPALFRKHAGQACDIERVSKFPDEVTEFWRVARLRNETVVERTADFLNWRFSSHFGDYEIYLGRSIRDWRLLGYLVLRRTEVRSIKNILDIVDLWTLESEEQLVVSFIDLAVRIGYNEGLDLVHCRIPPWHKHAAILHEKGFISMSPLLRLAREYRPRLILRQLSTEKRIPDMKHWFFSLADNCYA